MREYLRPVVALEWLKACCTDMITWMSSFSQEETLNTMTGTTSHGDVEDMELSDITQVTGDH